MDSDYILTIVICANYSRDFYGNTLLRIRKMRRILPGQLRGLQHRLEEGDVMISALHGLVDIDLPSGDGNPDICSIQGELVCDECLCNRQDKNLM